MISLNWVKDYIDLENEFNLISSKISNNLNFCVYERK